MLTRGQGRRSRERRAERVEWVEITGRTLEEARELALEALGVAESDAEVVVLSEPRPGLFGRMRGEARVRARVQPVGPRPKRTRRPRRRSDGSGEHDGRSSSSAGASNGADSGGSSGRSNSSRRRSQRSPAKATTNSDGDRSANVETPAGNGAVRTETEEFTMAEEVTLAEQGDAARQFLEGLLDAFGLEGDVSSRELDEETVEVAATKGELGLLVGRRGTTLAALQEVTRTVVQRRFPGKTDRIVVDVGGYRQRRIEALQRFTHDVASQVLESGAERSLEPMSPADRKVVHDTVNEIEGVVTRSEGEDAQRHVVIAPAG
jgi:spoIIIJ-associated protein